MNYKLEKSIWTDSDFEKMGWHDARIWSFLAEPDTYEFAFDLDYIFEWIDPEPGNTTIQFCVAPVTMIFHNAHSVQIDIESDQGIIEVADLSRRNATPSPNGKMTMHEYIFECSEGRVCLTATGYTMYVRQSPIRQRNQSLSLGDRGGISFDRITAVAV